MNFYYCLIAISCFLKYPFAETVGNNDDFEDASNFSRNGSAVRRRRDYDHGDYHVKCKSSNTGEIRFPILKTTGTFLRCTHVYVEGVRGMIQAPSKSYKKTTCQIKQNRALNCFPRLPKNLRENLRCHPTQIFNPCTSMTTSLSKM